MSSSRSSAKTVATEDREAHGLSVRIATTLGFTAVALLSCLAIGSVTYVLRSSGLRQREFAALERLRDSQQFFVSSWLSDLEIEARVWSREPAVVLLAEGSPADRTAAGRASRKVLPLLANGEKFLHAELLAAADGRILAAGGPPLKERGVATELARRARRERRVVLSDIVICPVHERPEVSVASPVFASSGKLVAVLYLRTATTLLTQELRRGRLGKTGEVLLVNSDGIAQSPLAFREDAIGRFHIMAEPARRGASGETGRIAAHDYRGTEVMAAYGHIPETGWGLVVKRDMSEIEAPVRAMARSVAVTTAGVLMAALLLGFIIATFLAHPAKGVNAVAERVIAGDLDARAPIRGPREWKRVASGINQMIARLARAARVRRALAEIYLEAGRATRPRDLLEAVLPRIMEATRSQLGLAYMASGEPGVLRLETAHGAPTGELPGSIHTSPPDHLLAEAAAARRVMSWEDLPKECRLSVRTQAGATAPRSLTSLPIIKGERVLAVIGLGSIYDLRTEDRDVVEDLSQHLGDRVAVCVGYEETQRLAQELASANEELTAQAEELKEQAEELAAQTEELKAQTEELEAQQRQLEETDRLKSQFLSTMSHELRTPLNSILALAQLMRSREPELSPAKRSEFLEVIERNGRQLLDLINDILDLSKIEAGRLELRPGTCDPLELVTDAVAIVQPLADKKGLKLEVQHPQPLPEIISDPDRVRQILLNLLSNAVKFTDEGRVTVNIGRADDGVRFTVRDTGPGIPAQHLPMIFDEFRQLDGSSTRRHGGTGLGLAISKRLAAALGGRLDAASTVGEGSTFALELPIRSARVLSEPPEPPAASAPVRVSAPLRRIEGRAPRVLVVDDNHVARLQLRTLAEDLGCSVSVASDGAEAVEVAGREAPDAIVLDLMMPGVDGFVALSELRANPATEEIPVLVLTAKQVTRDELELLRRNRVFQLIRKGAVDRQELASMLAEMLGLGEPDTTEDEAWTEEAPAVAAEGETAPVPEPRPEGEVSGSILIVEDNLDNLLVLKEIVEPLGAAVITSGDGEEALRLAAERHPDLVFMDLQLPGLDGAEATRRLKADPDLREIPVVIVTASAMVEKREKILASGCDDLVFKPVDTAEIERLVRRYLPATSGSEA